MSSLLQDQSNLMSIHLHSQFFEIHYREKSSKVLVKEILDPPLSLCLTCVTQKKFRAGSHVPTKSILPDKRVKTAFV